MALIRHTWAADQVAGRQMLLSAHYKAAGLSMDEYYVYTGKGEIVKRKPDCKVDRYKLEWEDGDKLVQCFFQGIIISFKTDQLQKLAGRAIRVDIGMEQSKANVQVPRPKIDHWFRLRRPDKNNVNQQISAYSFSEDSKLAVRTEVTPQGEDWITIIFPDGAHSVVLDYTNGQIFFGRTRITELIEKDVEISIIDQD